MFTAADSMQLGIVGNPEGDGRAVADVVLNYRLIIAKTYADPSVPVANELAAVVIEPLYSAVLGAVDRQRENQTFAVPSPTVQAWFRVLSDYTVFQNDSASVEACELDSRITMRHADGGDEMVDDTVGMIGWVFSLARVEGRWMISGATTSDEVKAKCGTG